MTSGSNGFDMTFWMSSWDYVKVEVLGFFLDFYEHECFVRSINATFMVLIPNKGEKRTWRIVVQ